MERKKRRRKRCGEIARVRARHARQMKLNPFSVVLVFIAAFLSMPLPVSFPTIPRRSDSGPEPDWPITDYERGYSTAPKRPRERYHGQPPMRRLMRDLRRPAARRDAEQVLLSRIADAGVREWASEQIRNDRINRLSIFVRPGIPEESIIASWRAELDAENAEKKDAADEAATQANILKALAALAGKESTSKLESKA